MTNLSYRQEMSLLRRKGEKYVRLAYELEHDASVLRAAGLHAAANGAKGLSSTIGFLGRSMREAAEGSSSGVL